MKYLLILFAISFVCSCTSEKLNNSALYVANYWQAEKYKAEKAESEKTIVLSLENFKKVEKDYPKNNITSISAVRFIENLPEPEYADCDNIKVAVKNNGESYEKTYKISELFVAKKLFYVVDRFFEKVKLSQYDQLISFFDTNNVPDSNITKIAQVMQRVDSAEGKINKTTIVGFDFRTVGPDKIPVLITHTNATYEKSYVDYTLVLRISDKKLVHLGMNENASY